MSRNSPSKMSGILSADKSGLERRYGSPSKLAETSLERRYGGPSKLGGAALNNPYKKPLFNNKHKKTVSGYTSSVLLEGGNDESQAYETSQIYEES